MKENKERGFSLIEVMMVVGLLSIVAVGFMTFMKNASKTQKTMMSSAEIKQVANEIRGFLSKTGMCNINFVGQKYDEEPFEIRSLRRLNGKEKYVVGQKYGDERVQITKMQFNEFEPDDNEGLMGTAKLEIYFAKGKNTYGGKELKRTINVDLVFDKSDYITGCNTAGSTTSTTTGTVATGTLPIDTSVIENMPDDGSGNKQKLLESIQQMQNTQKQLEALEKQIDEM